MKLHSDESAKAYEAAAQALREVKEARQLVAETEKQKADLSAISKRFPKPKPAPEPDPGPPTSVFDPSHGLRGVVERWRGKGTTNVQVDLDSVPEGETFLPHGAKKYVAHQEGVRDTEAIVGPARAKAYEERRLLIERVQEEGRAERERIEQVKIDQLQAARDYWEKR